MTSAAPAPTLTLRLAMAAAAFALAFGLSWLRIGHGAPDFYVFWTAARHTAAPYDPAIIAALERQIHLSGVWPFAYPPTFLLLVWPFAQAPLALAYPLWTGVSAALFFFAASHLVKPVWATLALAAAPIVFFSAMLGQTSLIVAAAMIGGWLWRDHRPLAAGALFGLAAAIKPQAMLLAPIVFWGRWRLLGAMAATGAAAAAASLVFGPERWLEWPHAVAAFRALVPATDRINPSALAAGPAWSLAMAALGLGLALACRNLVGLVCGALCFTPYAHAYDLAALTPLALTWLIDAPQRRWGHAVAGGALLAGLVATPTAALAWVAGVAALEAGPGAWQRLKPAIGSGRASAASPT